MSRERESPATATRRSGAAKKQSSVSEGDLERES